MEEFHIRQCPVCKRTPSIKRVISENTGTESKRTYVLSCCQITVSAAGETPVIVSWNKEVEKNEKKQNTAV